MHVVTSVKLLFYNLDFIFVSTKPLLHQHKPPFLQFLWPVVQWLATFVDLVVVAGDSAYYTLANVGQFSNYYYIILSLCKY